MLFRSFHPEDIVRHRLVRDIIQAFDAYHAKTEAQVDDGVGESLDPEAPRPHAPAALTPPATKSEDKGSAA